MWIFALVLLLSPAQSEADLIRLLDNVDPVVRANTAETLGILRSKAAVAPLINRLKDQDLKVRSAAVEALKRITEKDFGTDHAKWTGWWREEGQEVLRWTVTQPQEVEEIIRPIVEPIVERGKSEMRVLAITVVVIAILFVLVMIFFVGNVSSKLKEWKEVARQAESYLREGQEITKRTDKILEELESKKLDIVEFIGKLKDENQAELDRYSDLLQQNLEHRLREEIMGLRQKAEKELEQTLGERQSGIDHEIRRVVSQHREKLDKAVAEKETQFLRDVDAHTVYLEAQFHKAHGRNEEALRLYKKILAAKPDHAVAWSDMGTVLREMMRYDEALEAYERALAISPEDAPTLYHLAATHARQHRKRDMLEALGRAIRNDGEFKDEALNDPAFRDYWNDPSFKDIAEG